MNAPTLEPVKAVPSPPIASVAELRKRHSAMLQRQRSSEPSDRPTPGEILGFLHTGSALGTSLSDRLERETAQGVLDYWTASLLSQAPRAVEGTRPFVLLPQAEHETLEKAADAFERLEVLQTQQNLDAYFREAGAEQVKAMRIILRRMLRLKENSLEVFSAPVSKDDPELSKAEVAMVALELERAGVLVALPQEDATPPKWTLCNERLLREWSVMEEMVRERRGFREMSRGWEKGGRQKGALLSRSRQLENATTYQGLDETELAFLRASEQSVTKTRQALLGGLAIVGALLVAALVVTVSQAMNLRRTVGEKDSALKDKDAALKETEIARKNLEKSLQDLTVAKQSETDGVLPDLIALANLVAGRKDMTPDERKIVDRYRSQDKGTPENYPTTQSTGQSLANALTSPDAKTALQPGVRISAGNKSTAGSLGLFVKSTTDGQVYLMAPRFFLDGKPGDTVYAGETPIGTLTEILPTGRGGIYDFAIAKVHDPARVSNTLPGLGVITEVEVNPAAGTKVSLVGSGSGIRDGEVKRIGKEGAVITTRISQAGDAGAPVVTVDGNRLVGLLVARGISEDESVVIPVDQVLQKYNLQILKPNMQTQTELPLKGLLGEILVSAEDPAYVTQAQKYAVVLQDKGLLMPVSTAQPRKKVPPDITEVRCYDLQMKGDPNSAAHAVKNLLIQTGLPPSKVRVSYVEDKDAPKNFIQISMARSAFPVAPSPEPAPGVLN